MFFGDLREHFAVERNAGFFELIHQFAIRKAVFSRSRVDFYVPKFAEIPFLFSAVAEGMDASVEQRLFCGALFGFSLPPKTLSLAKDFVPAL